MSDELEKINQIFQTQDDQEKNTEAVKSASDTPHEDDGRKRPFRAVDKLLIDASGEEARNYTGDAESERDYRPVRQSHESRTGCLGGLM